MNLFSKSFSVLVASIAGIVCPVTLAANDPSGPIEEVKPPVEADLGTCAVASYPDDVSAFGVFDLAANVVEIAEDPRERSCWSKERGDHPCPRERRIASSGARGRPWACLLYTSPSPRDRQKSRMPSSA